MASKLAKIFGVVFVLVGVLGFIPNPIVGAEGMFETDLVHNIVHLVLGILLYVAGGKGESSAAMWMKVVAVIYLLVAVLGFVVGTEDKLLGLIHVNAADNWLHVVLGVVLFAAAMTSKKEVAPAMGQV
jgi:hypothetical protein